MTAKALASYIPRMANKIKDNNKSLKYKICAIAFSKRNNLLGIEMNGHRPFESVRRGGGDHAETKLIKKFGRRIDRIYIMRVGKTCDALPIHACENCSKVADKYGIKIIPLHEQFEDLNEFIKK
jgi:hypothetical protein